MEPMNLIQPRRFHPWKALWVLAVLIAVFVYTSRRDTPGPANPSWTGKTMGSTYSVKLVGSRLSAPQLENLKAAVDAALVEVNRQMSHYVTNSELSRFNQSTSTAPFEVSEAFAGVTRFALELSEKTDGMFDPTLGPLIDLWGFGPKPRRDTEPSESEIAAAEALCGYRHLSVVSNRFLQKDIPGLRLNLSAIAAGYGSDEAARVIRAAGISNLFVDVTGEVLAFGVNAEGNPWRVGVDLPDPDSMPGENLATVLHLSAGSAVATSGNYRNFFQDENGRVYSHIFNPKLGRPVSHNLASVSVAATNCMVADGLSTTLFVLGPVEGPKWIETYPGAAALFIVRNEDGSFTQFASRGFAAMTGYAPPSP
jgi:FAD:protein FMN transferase